MVEGVIVGGVVCSSTDGGNDAITTTPDSGAVLFCECPSIPGLAAGTCRFLFSGGW